MGFSKLIIGAGAIILAVLALLREKGRRRWRDAVQHSRTRGEDAAVVSSSATKSPPELAARNDPCSAAKLENAASPLNVEADLPEGGPFQRQTEETNHPEEPRSVSSFPTGLTTASAEAEGEPSRLDKDRTVLDWLPQPSNAGVPAISEPDTVDSSSPESLLYRPSRPRTVSAQKKTRKRGRASKRSLRLFVRAIQKAGAVRIALLPQRLKDHPEQITVQLDGKRTTVNSMQEEWFESIDVDNLSSVLLYGLEMTARLGEGTARWRLRGREIYVLSSRFHLRGFINVPRLAVGRKHWILCTAERLNEVVEAIALLGSVGPQILDSNCGLPAGWFLLQDVVPCKGVLPDPEAGLLTVLQPSLEARICFEGGIRLHRSSWLEGCPPRIRVYGLESLPEVKIDGHRAAQLADGSFAAEGTEAVGTHTVTCSGVSRSFSVEPSPVEWPQWEAHRCGDPDSTPDTFICGALVNTPEEALSQAVSSLVDPVEWRVVGQDGQIWAQHPLRLRSSDVGQTSQPLLEIRFPKQRWAGNAKLAVHKKEFHLGGQATQRVLAIALKELCSDWPRGVDPLHIKLQSRFGDLEVAAVYKSWTIELFECIQEIEADRLFIVVSWKESGTAEGRKVCVHSREGELVSSAQADQVPVRATVRSPGRHTVKLSGYDLAGAEKEFKSFQFEVEILDSAQILEHGEVILSSIKTPDGDEIPLEVLSYKVYVTGKIVGHRIPSELEAFGFLVKSINEGWYVGRLLITEKQYGYDLTKDLVQNPVKFEFDPDRNEIPAVEDKAGDGGIFCPLCSRLFWSRKAYDAEISRGHKEHLCTEFRLKIRKTSMPSPVV